MSEPRSNPPPRAIKPRGPSVRSDPVSPSASGNITFFEDFKLDRANYSLHRRDGRGDWTAVPIRRKDFDVLRYMVDNPNRLIAPDEFMQGLWPSIHVQPEVLKGHIRAIRAAVGDDSRAPRHIETVRGRGYRFKAPITGEIEARPLVPHSPERTPRLAGRETAMNQLEALRCRAHAGVAQVVFVTGEAGIGKSTLGINFLDATRAEGATIAVGRCFAGSAEIDAYAAVLELLDQLGRSGLAPTLRALIPELAPTWLVQLSHLTEGVVAGDTRRNIFGSTSHRVNRELCDLLSALSQDTLLVLLIEDIHWADRATLDFVAAMAARAPQGRLMLLLTLRPPHWKRQLDDAWLMSRSMCLYKTASEIALAALAEQDVEQVLSDLAGNPVLPELARQLHRRSEGNPLFLRAIYEHLLAEKRIAYGSSGWTVPLSIDQTLEVPPSLADLINSEIDKLDATTRAVVEAASLSEEPFVPLIHAAGSRLDEDVFEDICEGLVRTTALIRRSDLLTLGSGRKVQCYEFRHTLFRLAIYDRQSRTRRAAAHARVAERLIEVFGAERSVAPVVARHFLAAEQWSEAVNYLQVAARTLMQRFSNREASAVLERALNIIPHLPASDRERWELELLEELARVYVGALDPRAQQVYERLATLSGRIGRDDVHCRALLGWAFTVAWTDCESAMAIWREAIDRSAALQNPIVRARIRSAAHGWRNWAAGWSAEDALGCELAVGELRQAGDQASLNAALVDYTLVLFPSAQYLQAYDTIVRSFAYLTENGLDQRVDISLPLWIWRLGRPWTMMNAGRLGQALELFDSGIEGFRDNGEIARAATLQFYKALCCSHATLYAEALRLCREARDLFGQAGTSSLSPNEELIGAVSEGIALVGAGHFTEAMRLLEFARRGISDKWTLSTWHWRMAMEWGLADACIGLGRVEEAAEQTRQFRDHALATQETTWRVLSYESSARVALRLNDTVAARKYLALGRQEASKADVPLAAWRLDSVQSALFAAVREIENAAHYSRLAKEGFQRLTTSLPKLPQYELQSAKTGRIPLMGSFPTSP